MTLQNTILAHLFVLSLYINENFHKPKGTRNAVHFMTINLNKDFHRQTLPVFLCRNTYTEHILHSPVCLYKAAPRSGLPHAIAWSLSLVCSCMRLWPYMPRYCNRIMMQSGKGHIRYKYNIQVYECMTDDRPTTHSIRYISTYRQTVTYLAVILVSANIDKMVVHSKQNIKHTNPLEFRSMYIVPLFSCICCMSTELTTIAICMSHL